MSIGVVDLFCGVGGLTCGIKMAGINVVAGIDLDETCEYPYTRNNNAIFIHKSIADITGKEIKRLLRGYEIKVLVGCAPCQPFSNHQKDKKHREMHKDWSLLYEFSRVIEESKPHIISMENVPALEYEQVFIDFVECLNRLKYHVSYSVVNVSLYGVAQSRKRLILFASKFNQFAIIPPTHTDAQPSVKDVIGGLPPLRAGETYDADTLHQSPRLSDINLKRIIASRPNGTWRDWPDDLILPCHKKDTGKTYPSVYGRMSWDALAPTITTQFTCYGTGRFGHPSQNRAISLREGALLQSFPDGYAFVKDGDPIHFKKISKHIGNAVPPRLGQIIGVSILRSMSETKWQGGNFGGK